MKKIFLAIFVLFFFISVCFGQYKEITSAEFEKLCLDSLNFEYLGLFHFGYPNFRKKDGTPINISRRNPIKIKSFWEKIVFNKSDSILVIEGSIFDNTTTKNFEIITGTLILDSLNRNAEVINTDLKFFFNTIYFKRRIKIKNSDDVLCFVIPDEKYDDESVARTEHFPLIYKIGELIK